MYKHLEFFVNLIFFKYFDSKEQTTGSTRKTILIKLKFVFSKKFLHKQRGSRKKSNIQTLLSRNTLSSTFNK